MKNNITSSAVVALLIWVRTALLFAVLMAATIFLIGNVDDWQLSLVLIPASLFGSLPALVVLFLGAGLILRFLHTYDARLRMFCLMLTGILLVYAGGAFLMVYFSGEFQNQWTWWLGIVAALTLSVVLACYFTRKKINRLLSIDIISFQPFPLHITSQSIMEQTSPVQTVDNRIESSSPILFKGVITGVLILLMMIPTLFISSLVQERKGRQQEIVREVSQRWAGAQKLSGLFLVLPYEVKYKDEKGKELVARRELTILPEDLKASSKLDPEVRERSIYKVLLYHTTTQFSGQFNFPIPRDIDPEAIFWKDASVCMGLTDIKGIEEKVVVQLGDQTVELAPGLPNKDILKTGLSAPVDLSLAAGAPLQFSTRLKLKGSEQLHFVPLAGNSSYEVQSSWKSPSFDGNNLPAEHAVGDSGFSARWAFSKANLPFGTVLRDTDFNENDFSFGVTMVQPADQYAKTERSVKYAILFIGLTFALFLVLELMQKKPVHPIQYVLIGIALSVFYTLLLSVSEFLAFDYAYAIATVATVSLITLYAQSHFRSWKTSSLFGTVLTTLYLFAFVLVRLEDTALLVGSIGLFIILALVMYGTRKIKWYPGESRSAQPEPVL